MKSRELERLEKLDIIHFQENHPTGLCKFTETGWIEVEDGEDYDDFVCCPSDCPLCQKLLPLD